MQHIYEPTRNPTAAETQLGWYLFGPKNWYNAYLNEITNIQFIQTRDDLNQMHSLYESELSGVEPSKLYACSDNVILVIESNFIRHIKSTIHQTENGRIEVSLPWKKGFPACLKSNYFQAPAKLKRLEKRLMKFGIVIAYKNEIKIIINEFAERVPTGHFKSK